MIDRIMSKVKYKLLSREEDIAAAYCENCGQHLDRFHTWEPDYTPNYCPNCGAKLVREVER